MAASTFIDLLSHCPGLSVDLVEAAISYQVSDHLNARWVEFCSFVDGRNEAIWPKWRRLSSNARTTSIDKYYAGSFTSRKELLDSLFASGKSGNQTWIKQTSGTSGTPLNIPYSRDFFFEQRFLDIPKILYLRAIKTTTTSVLCVHLTDTPTINPSLFMSPIGGREIYANLRLPDPSLSSMLATLNPAVLSSRPELLEVACNQGLLSNLNLELIISAGSYLSPQRKALIEKEANAPCVNVYALSEVGIVASECAAGRLHVHGDTVLVEIADGDVIQQEASLGEIVVSSFANSSLPLSRYRTKDQGYLEYSQCRCGRAGAQLILTQGRTVPLFKFKSCPPWSPTCFNRLPFDFPVSEYQVRQTDNSAIEITIQPLDSNNAEDNFLCQAIEDYARSRLPGGVRVKVATTQFNPLKKHIRYVDPALPIAE